MKKTLNYLRETESTQCSRIREVNDTQVDVADSAFFRSMSLLVHNKAFLNAITWGDKSLSMREVEDFVLFPEQISDVAAEYWQEVGFHMLNSCSFKCFTEKEGGSMRIMSLEHVLGPDSSNVTLYF